jgi:hypothetical protein
MDVSVNKILEALTPALSGEITRLVQEATQEQDTLRQQQETEFNTRLETAVRDAEARVRSEAETEKAQAVAAVREEAAAGKANETQFAAEREQWLAEKSQLSEEKTRLEADMSRLKEEMTPLREQATLWRTYAEAQSAISDSASQPEMLNKFLQFAEAFAPAVAVYVAKPEGLELWKSRGTSAFPKSTADENLDPDTYFKTIVVRGKTLAAVCARRPYKSEPLDYLSGCLGRAVESFALKLSTPTPRPAVPVGR